MSVFSRMLVPPPPTVMSYNPPSAPMPLRDGMPVATQTSPLPQSVAVQTSPGPQLPDQLSQAARRSNATPHERAQGVVIDLLRRVALGFNRGLLSHL